MVYQVGINKGIILRCTAYQISRTVYHVDELSSGMCNTELTLMGIIFEISLPHKIR